jgi:ribonuclease PH
MTASAHGFHFPYNCNSELKLLSSYRRATEISLVIRQTMEASILTHLMPRSQVSSIY